MNGQTKTCRFDMIPDFLSRNLEEKMQRNFPRKESKKNLRKSPKSLLKSPATITVRGI